ncbi:dioxygenase [Paenibacillus elgii]|uniref:Dioxygenase n=1 Tax=Paenibacillus elgii TaxID=189691 RepID=A0A2T6FSK3_9BACL|nr:class III extradiol ring-cleavage dioxygenase [Paenibacillus elgii]PUA34892.1 dioxygenase [Paenibacillus elgii]
MYPSFFLAHGLPTLVTEPHSYSRFLRSLGAQLPKPAGIVVFSAHWESEVQTIGAAAEPDTLHDFFGFPEKLYGISYPAKGNILLAMGIGRLFAAEGIACALDDTRGLDHGVWTLLSLMHPAADVPVVHLSVNPLLVPEEQYRIGRALQALRSEGMMIVGSGGTVHHPGTLHWQDDAAELWAKQFDAWLYDRITVWDSDALFDYERRAPHASLAVPTAEHFAPLLIAMGAADRSRRAKLMYQKYQYGTLSLGAWMFS